MWAHPTWRRRLSSTEHRACSAPPSRDVRERARRRPGASPALPASPPYSERGPLCGRLVIELAGLEPATSWARSSHYRTSEGAWLSHSGRSAAPPRHLPQHPDLHRHDAKAARRGCRQEPVQPTGWRLKAAYRAAREPRDGRSGMRSSSRHVSTSRTHSLVAYSDNDASRADPAGGRRKLPHAPDDPRKTMAKGPVLGGNPRLSPLSPEAP